MELLRGAPVAAALNERLKARISDLLCRGVTPKLAVVRVGEKGDDIAYEKSIVKRFNSLGALAEVHAFPSDISQEQLEEAVRALNSDERVHGILLFRPLPEHLREGSVKALVCSGKDVDGMGEENLAKVFAADPEGYAPCTAQAVLELLDYYEIRLSGKRTVVVGRSLVIGKPVAMLLLARNATVTICHTGTRELAQECRSADLIVACAGSAGMIKRDYTNEKQILIDVGINVVDGKICGDVDFEAAAERVRGLTPVPGGVGAVTASVLLEHTVLSAQRADTKIKRGGK